MSFSGSLAIYTHVLGALESGGLLYFVYRKHAALTRTPGLIPVV